MYNACTYVRNASKGYVITPRVKKSEKRGIANAKMYTFLGQNIVMLGHSFAWINEYRHRSTFGIFYFVKYYDIIEIQCGASYIH